MGDLGNEVIPSCRQTSAIADIFNLEAETHQEQPESALLAQETVRRKNRACNREFKTNGGKTSTKERGTSKANRKEKLAALVKKELVRELTTALEKFPPPQPACAAPAGKLQQAALGAATAGAQAAAT